MLRNVAAIVHIQPLEKSPMTPPTPDSIQAWRLAASQITAAVLNRHVALWGVMHGAEDYPTNVGRDLDILVHPDSLADLSIRLSESISSAGWTVSIVRLPWDVTQVIASRTLSSGKTVAFETDLIARQVWCGIPLTIGPPCQNDLRELDGGMRLDLWGGFVKALLVQSLAGNWTKMLARRHEWQLDSDQESVITRRLSGLVGSNAAAAFLAALKSSDEASLRIATGRLKRQLLLRHLCRPVLILVHGSRWLSHRWRQRTASIPASPLLILTKSSGDSDAEIIDGLKQEFGASLVFPGIRPVPRPANNDTESIRSIRHLSAMGVLCVLIIGDGEQVDEVDKWFPVEGVVRARWLGRLPDGIAASVMQSFHAMHRAKVAA